MNIAPITVLCGANSSGKSSVLKSLLLIKQSSVERRSGLAKEVQSPPLLLNGEWTRLGSYSDMVHLKNRKSSVEFNWSAVGDIREIDKELGPRFRRTGGYRGDREIRVHISSTFASDSALSEELATYLASTQMTIGELAIGLSGSNSQSMRSGIYRIRINDVSKLLNRYESSFKRYTIYENVELGKLLVKSSHSIETGNVRVRLAGPFVLDLEPVFDGSWEPFLARLLSIALSDRTGKRGPVPSWFIDLQAAVKDFGAARDDDNLKSKAALSARVNKVLSLARYLLLDVQAAFLLGRISVSPLWRQIRYLGPLRHQPQRYYQFDDTGGIDIGVSGEFTVQVLALEADNVVSSNPIASNADGEVTLLNRQDFSLIDLTNYWLDLMGLPSVTPATLRQSLYEMKVGKLEVALPDVGFGVSQVLPIIVEALRAMPGETVILEQPEIHLHPRVQAVLADFLIARSNDGIRFIVETHSDHLVKRLARRIAEGSISKISERIAVFFVAGGAEEGSAPSQILINEYGEIQNWPPGFFDQNEDLYWTAASLRRRRSLKKKLREVAPE